MIWTKSPFFGPMSIFRGVSIYVGVIDSKQDTAGRISWCPWHSWVRFVKSCVILDFDSLRWHCCYNPSLACGMICWMHGLRSPNALFFEWMDDGWKEKTYEIILWTGILNTYYFEHIYIYMKIWRPCIKSMVERIGQVPQETKISPEDLAQWASTPEAMLLGDDGRKWPSSLVSGIQCER